MTASRRFGTAATVLAVATAAALTSAAAGAGSPGGSVASRPVAASTGAAHAVPRTPSAPAAVAPAAAAPAAVDPAVARATAVVASMSLRQRVGQMLAVGVPSVRISTASSLVARYGVGTVFLSGRDASGVGPVAARNAQLQRAATASATRGVLEFVAVDQEGGAVQSLSGPGISTIPSALAQAGQPAATIRDRAALWARQLRRAGVTLDLAPVSDVVPPAHLATNQPIARYHREFGTSEAAVAAAVGPWSAGTRSAGVQPTVKHFPGLGRVVGNTDTTARVVDDETTRTTGTLVPWRAGLWNGAGVVMVSSAVYSRIDASSQAVFSPVVVAGMIRHDMGFGGVVMTDDMGNAAAVGSVPVGQRATRFVSAGGDLVLTVDAGQIPTMSDALVATAQANAAFARQVQAAAVRVVTLKYRTGLVPR